MTAWLAPFACTLVGYGVVRRAAPSWGRAACLGAGMVLGPPLATLGIFLWTVAGLPYGPWLGPAVLVAGIALCAAPVRRLPVMDPPLSRGALLASAAGALWLFCALCLQWLARPTPDSDGMLNFGFKARAFHALGDPIAFLQEERLFAVHPDYPLHVPYAMCLSWLWSGDMAAWHALTADMLILPGAALFLGAIVGVRSAAAAAVVVVLFALLPAVRFGFVLCGADSILAAVTLVAGCGLLSRNAAPVAGGLAAGLLTWVKLEGIVILVVLLSLALLRSWPRPRDRVRVLVAALPGAIWPATLALAGLRLPVAEVETVEADGAYAELILESFARNVIDPDRMGLVLIPIGLACALALLRGTRSSVRRVAGAFLLLAILYPLLVWLRRSRPEDIQVYLTRRLVQQGIPLGLLVLGWELADTFARRAADPRRSSDRARGSQRRP